MEEILGTIYTNCSDDFVRGIYPIARTIKAEQYDLAVVTAVRSEDVEEKRLGNIYGFDGGNYAGNVYDKDSLSPTIRTYQGGNQQPMIVDKTIPLGNLNGHKLGSGYAGSVYDENGLAPTINTMGGGNREPMIVAMRGRNPDNPSDRTAGSPTEQRLEPNSQGICNTLTSVQKYNMVLETIVVKTRKMRIAEGNICGALTTDSCTSASHNGSYGVITKDICINDRGSSEIEPQVSIGVAPTLRAETHGNLPKVIETQYRIRKLTPLECWRLMGFSDEDFQKAEKVNSNSQLYKQAGNSIVRNVLMAIFGQMIPGKENIYKEL